MNCPVCGSKTKVIGSKDDCESVHRRRRCDDCKHVFYTAEYEVRSSDHYDALMNQYMKQRCVKLVLGTCDSKCDTNVSS